MDIPIWKCLFGYYSVCIVSVVDDDSRAVWQMYSQLGGFAHETYRSYMELPAVIVDAFSVIEAEIARIEEVRASKVAAKLEGGKPEVTRRGIIGRRTAPRRNRR